MMNEKSGVMLVALVVMATFLGLAILLVMLS